MTSGPAVGLQGRLFLCLSVRRNVGDPGPRRGHLDGGHFKMTSRCRVPVSYKNSLAGAAHCGCCHALPPPSQMSSTPQVSMDHCPFCFLSLLSVTCQEVNCIWNLCLLSRPCLHTADHLHANYRPSSQGNAKKEVPGRSGSSVHWPSPSGTLRESNDQAYHVLHTPLGHKGVFL